MLPHKRATEPFRRSVFQQHWDGISRSRLGQREGIGSATVERWFEDFLKLRAAERRGACPRVLGIDEHFFTRLHGYATTFCDLRGHKVFDVVLGRSEAALESYLKKLEGKDRAWSAWIWPVSIAPWSASTSPTPASRSTDSMSSG